jgi:biopolymer transport protein TolQ
MTFPLYLLAQAQSEFSARELSYVWEKATPVAKVIILVLVIFSIFAWSVMAAKVTQMRRANKLNRFFLVEFRQQKNVLSIIERQVQVDGCPLFSVYRAGCAELAGRQQSKNPEVLRRRAMTLTSMEHVKRAIERAVAEESLRLESGLILLAIAVSGAPFLGLLGTVWGVMSTFSNVAMEGHADLPTMAPGVAAALITTVAGLLVAIPSMFGYNWLVHNLRVLTVELDNFAQELVSKMEIEFLDEHDRD